MLDKTNYQICQKTDACDYDDRLLGQGSYGLPMCSKCQQNNKYKPLPVCSITVFVCGYVNYHKTNKTITSGTISAKFINWQFL